MKTPDDIFLSSKQKMSSRYHKALVKAEKEHAAALLKSQEAYEEWFEASHLTSTFEREFGEKNPTDKWGYHSDSEYQRLERISNAYYHNERLHQSKTLKTREILALKQRQLADFLARCPRNCVCGEPDTGAMVQCDGCKNWFHLTCAKLTEEEAQTLPRFDCLMCLRMAVTQSESPAPSSPPNTPEVEAPHSQSACTLS